jgi:hypothetical protein
MTVPPVEPSQPARERVRRPEAEHVAAVVALARSASPTAVSGRMVVIAVDGRSGSGKTLLGRAVATSLACPVVHLDALYPGWDGLQAGVDLLATHVLEPLARGGRGSYARWDWVRNRPGRTVTVEAGPLLVVEGCGTLVTPAAEFAAVRVWLEAPATVRKERALARDGDTYAPHWDRWAAQEDAVYDAARPCESAHLVLRTAAT